MWITCFSGMGGSATVKNHNLIQHQKLAPKDLFVSLVIVLLRLIPQSSALRREY